MFRLAYGNESGLVIVDIVQKISLIVLNTSDLGSGDPYQRVLRSPKRQDELRRENEDKARSPSTDQVKCTFFLSVLCILKYPQSLPLILSRPLILSLFYILYSAFSKLFFYCMITKCLYKLIATIM